MSQPRPAKITAIVTTLDEEHNIGACLESLLWCDEILVADSYSVDRTSEIVGSFPAVSFLQHPYGYAALQKNWAIDRTHHDWILILDADERCTPELRCEIEQLLVDGPRHESYRLRRRLYFLDQRVRFCGWHDDTVVRLFRRGSARYPDQRVHADMITAGPAPTLRHSLDHFMVDDMAEYLQRVRRYGEWGAAQAYLDGRRSGVMQFVGRPLWRLLRSYFLQLGFLDGRVGVMFCAVQAYGTFLKWSILWGYRRAESAGREPALPNFDLTQPSWVELGSRASGGQPK